MAVAGGVLCVQGHPGAKPTTDIGSFWRPTAEANWPFAFVTPVDGGLWVDSYQALIKLQ